ncbi:NAD(P)-binding domain-containing protein [Streptomyces sp. NBC_00513]|uniref:NAD(P)-binding domain-containing protein n=1 Tax=unclassified Streptomyces TaxID=2593676 RepID=UPI00225B1C0B|nr:NAD(P)-binding domain-containing protein [Streptomyces sp. NBC_00424]MCX5076923.1 NAD(P)-binding domain-containing protein [Streptomyces sp. NBC_00424]WUD40070.1 NAD(P)-binding domain-containing protein [Streptomyces sp. NBC_00513]
MTHRTDVVVIGGGQSGLAAGYHLRRLGVEHVILDAQAGAGRRRQAQAGAGGRRRGLAAHLGVPPPVRHGVGVSAVHRDGAFLRVETDCGDWQARVVVSAAGTWIRPFMPAVPGRREFTGRQPHTVQYRSPAGFAGRRVVVVGGGNSGAQIAADLARTAQLTWVTQRPPRYLADDIDGRALFDAATARRRALDEGRSDTGGVASLGDIVAVPSVRAARDAGLLRAKPMFARLAAAGVEWADGTRGEPDAVTWCTGFRPALAPCTALRLRGTRGHIATDSTRAVDESRLHLLGYGGRTGPASATLIGVGRPARDAAHDIASLLR